MCDEKFGLIITLYYPNKTTNVTFHNLTKDECYEKLILYIAENINLFCKNKDLSLDYNEFNYIWFDDNTEYEFFSYSMYNHINGWETPWENIDVFPEIINKTNEQDIYNNNINMESEDSEDSEISPVNNGIKKNISFVM